MMQKPQITTTVFVWQSNSQVNNEHELLEWEVFVYAKVMFGKHSYIRLVIEKARAEQLYVFDYSVFHMFDELVHIVKVDAYVRVYLSHPFDATIVNEFTKMYWIHGDAC